MGKTCNCNSSRGPTKLRTGPFPPKRTYFSDSPNLQNAKSKTSVACLAFQFLEYILQTHLYTVCLCFFFFVVFFFVFVPVLLLLLFFFFVFFVFLFLFFFCLFLFVFNLA